MNIRNSYRRLAGFSGASCAATGLLSLPAQAHFLWGKMVISPSPEYRLTFSDDGVSKTPADLLPKIAPARAWTAGGVALALSPNDGALGAVIPRGAGAIGARQTWGVYDHAAAELGVFLLRYDAKAAASEADAARPAGLPVEVFVHRSGGDLIAHVVEDGKPAARAEVWVNAPGQSAPLTLSADAEGNARFSAAEVGECLIRAMVADPVSGEEQGRHYDLIRCYSTLTFPVSAAKASTRQPALKSNTPAQPLAANSEAYTLLRDAHDHRQTFSPQFPGMTASVAFDDNGKEYAGKVSSDAQDTVTVDVAGLSGADADWVEDQLENLIGHRRGDSFAQGEGKYPISFGPDDRSPLGRQVVLHDPLQSSYRVRDHQLIDVTRTMMGQKFSITVLESIETDDSKYLPHQFIVTYFSAKTGAIDHVEAYTDTYVSLNGEWLPASRRVITAKDGKFTTRTITLTSLRVVSK